MKSFIFFIVSGILLASTVYLYWPELTEKPQYIEDIENHETRINRLEQKLIHIKLAVLETI